MTSRDMQRFKHNIQGHAHDQIQDQTESMNKSNRGAKVNDLGSRGQEEEGTIAQESLIIGQKLMH